jgi:phage terminase large subunit-like protein
MDEAELRRLVDEAALLDDEAFERFLRGLPAPVRRVVEEAWCLYARDGQREPASDWRVWLMMAGRAFGKTRAGAEWVWARVRSHHDAASTGVRVEGPLRIALVGANMDDVEKVMVKGESGLQAVAGTGEEARWVASRQMAVFSLGGGVQAEGYAYSGEKPDKLRGPQHHFAWCDELAKWTHGQATWDNLMLGLRLGERPRTLVTTTPRSGGASGPLLKHIQQLERCALTRGRTSDNPVLTEDFLAAVHSMYAGTRLGRQELEGELIEDVEGALWSREMIESSRSGTSTGEMGRIVIGVDPPAGVGGDACGIVVCGRGEDGVAYVLEDASVEGLSPDGWAAAVARAARRWGASRVVAEANQGGRMVESVLRAVEPELPLKLVHASEGKCARAEPVAALFERGRAKFAGCFPRLEDELAGLTIAGGYEGPGRSPDRADACVWAMSELMLGKAARVPRVLTF